MRNRASSAAWLAISIFAVGQPALADASERTNERASLWQQMEENGRITVSDIRRRAGAVFSTLDSNGNGVLTRPELMQADLPDDLGRVAHSAELRGQLFARLDLDGNDQVSQSEWQDAIHKSLGMADLDGNGTITLSELSRVDGTSAFFNMLGF